MQVIQQTVSAVQMQNTPGRNALSDADKLKIQRDITKIKSDAENSSKIVDENGGPLVVYHQSSEDGEPKTLCRFASKRAAE